MRRIAVAVHEDDGRRPDAGLKCGAELACDRVRVRRRQDIAVGVQAFVDFDHPFIEHFGQLDLAIEQFRPVLIADPERIAEAFGDDQHGAVAGAFQQRIGGDGGAHAHDLDGAGRDRIGRG